MKPKNSHGSLVARIIDRRPSIAGPAQQHPLESIGGDLLHLPPQASGGGARLEAYAITGGP